ncbi:MAG: cobalt transporter CbiM, partial [Synergistaceae bacterium]|nr:cobalt transporter CbiM [Synergistaceae bacterium]
GTIACTAIGLRKTDTSKIVRTALISSSFFLASLVNIRIGPSSTHLSLLAPVGLILGWSSFPAMLIALFLQAVLFHFGGLLVLGANTFIMGIPALIVHILFGKMIHSESKIYSGVTAFIAGVSAVLMGACLAGVFLGISDRNFLEAAKLLFYAHIPLALIEGAVTSFMIMFLKRTSPEFLS